MNNSKDCKEPSSLVAIHSQLYWAIGRTADTHLLNTESGLEDKS